MILALSLLFSLSGCRNRGEEENPNSIPETPAEEELVIYHNSTELAPMLMSLAEEYSSATGKKVSAKLGGSNFFEDMKSMNSAIYVVDTHSDLSAWHSGGLFSDLMNESGFAGTFSDIPSGIQLNSSGIGSFGVPLVLEGYGYIFDKDMLGDLFGEANKNELVNDLRTCSFTDFEGFVAAVDTYISAPSSAAVTVNGNSYAFLPEKTGRAKNLTGVFSLNSESTRAMEHLLSYGLAAKFQSRYEVMTADEEAVSGMKDIASAYMDVLDLHTSHIAGTEGSISRGEEFMGGDYNYSTSVDLFTKGYALFYPGGTSDAADFRESSAEFGTNLDIIPMKLPLSDENITAVGMTAEKLQSSIVIGSRYYIAFNPNADENLSSEARDFVNWIFNDEAGKTAYSSAFGKLPFNFEYNVTEAPTEPSSSEAEETPEETASPAEENPAPESETPSENSEPSMMETTPSHSLSESLYIALGDYYANGNWIPDMSAALPTDFAEKVLGEGTKDYWGMETWSDDDRAGFVDKILGGWKDRLNKDNAAVG